MKKKQKKSLFAILSAIIVLTLATLLVVIYNGITQGWEKLGEIFTSGYAISIYVIIGILLILLLNLFIIFNRKKEIK